MMKRVLAFLAAFAVLTGTALADETQFSFGGDEYAAGDSVTLSEPVARNAFAAGNSVNVSAPVTGTAHLAGNSVSLSGRVGGAVYAAGNNVNISAGVADDVTAAGSTVTLSGDQGVGGNVRLAGDSVSIDAPVRGSALVAGRTVHLTAPVDGDFFFAGDTLTFSGNARISGKVTIRSDKEITVPENVAPAAQVTYEKLHAPDFVTNAGDIARKSVKSFWWIFLPALWLAVVFFIIGVLWLALFPRRSAIAYRVAMGKPFRSFWFGMLGLAAFIGLIPVFAMTVIGIPLVPVEIVVLIIAWVIGSIAGAYFIAMRVLVAFGMNDARIGSRVIALVVGLVGAWILGLVPFFGWLVHLVLLFLGLGGIVLAALARWTDRTFHDGIVREVESLDRSA